MTGIGAVFYRDYRQRMTNIGFVFWDLFVPLAYLVLFGMGFEGMLGSSVAVGGQGFWLHCISAAGCAWDGHVLGCDEYLVGLLHG